MKKECIAMLLAGGQGTRLMSLTHDVAKPAVSFGGKYRIIDFTLSNCTNSGIDTIGVLTQYKPFDLNSYIGNGQPWDLDRLVGGAFVLPPYSTGESGDWYKGTANAIYQNINFIDRFDPEYVLVLSGDHIYKMDYSKMLDFHKANNSDLTVAVIDVPLSDASRFGIMNLNPDNSIYEFEEKPKNPKSTKASMGIYIFNWQKLKKYLIEDENNPASANDFGKNIIPTMLASGERLFAYSFDGYWKDVGTIESLWMANMDIIDENSGINLSDSKWKIYSRNVAEPCQYIGESAVVDNSLITDGCVIEGSVINSVISNGAIIEAGAKVINSCIMPNAIVKANATVAYSIVGNDAIISEGAAVGHVQEMKDGHYDIKIVDPGTTWR